MRVLTEKALLVCDHGGVVGLKHRQDWVQIEKEPVLVENDPLHRPVHGCPMTTPTTPACAKTITVDEAKSYAAFVTLRTKGDDARRLCLDTATGKTDWSRSVTVNYKVARPGQDFVRVQG